MKKVPCFLSRAGAYLIASRGVFSPSDRDLHPDPDPPRGNVVYSSDTDPVRVNLNVLRLTWPTLPMAVENASKELKVGFSHVNNLSPLLWC